MSVNHHNSCIKVSAVIPTRHRPALVLRAVRSALAQSLAGIEVIVVVDGPDPLTIDALEQAADERVRIVQLPQSAGATEARNRGAIEARGEWVAFLDDDDEWLPTKLEKQVRLAEDSRVPNPIISCRFFARTPSGEYEWPRKIPRLGEEISDYLFARRSLFQAEGFVTTTTLLARKQLLVETPFQKGLPRHQDTDWVLRALRREDVGIEFVPEPLAIWYGEESRPSIANKSDWRDSLSWIQRNRHLVTKRAYSGFILTFVSSGAAFAGEWRAIFPLVRESFAFGKPSWQQLLIFSGLWAMPNLEVRRWLRSAIFARPKRALAKPRS